MMYKVVGKLYKNHSYQSTILQFTYSIIVLFRQQIKCNMFFKIQVSSFTVYL